MYPKILIPVDGSELAECVLPHLETVVKGCGVREITFLRVVEPMPTVIAGGDYFPGEEETEKLRQHHEKAAQDYLDQLINPLSYGEIAITGKVKSGKVAEIIADYAMHQQMDLVIMATHGRSGVSRWVMGSVAERVLRWSCAPVLVVRPPQCAPKL